MEIKGSAVKSILAYIKKNYPTKFIDWVKSLPIDSKEVFSNGVLSNEWYNAKVSTQIPTEKVAEILFDGDAKKAAWQLGRFSADDALTGVYKIYVRMSSPKHIMDRASRIFATYYRPSELYTENRTSKGIDVVISKFGDPHDIYEYRIAGWMERALEISSCKNVKVNIASSLTRGDSKTIFELSWE